MDYNILKSIRTAGLITLFMTFSSAGYSVGPILAALTETIELARIQVDVSDTNPSSGEVTATIPGCEQCETYTLQFDNQTQFINLLGAERPVAEMKNASGRIAMIRYQIDSGLIEWIQVYPELKELR